MATFHVKMRTMYEETIAVDAESNDEALLKLETWRDCETVESDPVVGSSTVLSVVMERDP